MSVKENKESIRRHVDEIWNKGNMRAVNEFVAPNLVSHSHDGSEIKGPEGFKQSVIATRNAFPDVHLTIDNMIGEGDYLSVQYTLTGTFTGKIGAVKPNGKPIRMKHVVIHRFENGKQVEAWGYADNLALFRQLGIPIPNQ